MVQVSSDATGRHLSADGDTVTPRQLATSQSYDYNSNAGLSYQYNGNGGLSYQYNGNPNGQLYGSTNANNRPANTPEPPKNTPAPPPTTTPPPPPPPHVPDVWTPPSPAPNSWIPPSHAPDTWTPAPPIPDTWTPPPYVPDTWTPAPYVPDTWTPAPYVPDTWTPAPSIPDTWTPPSSVPDTWTPPSSVQDTWTPPTFPPDTWSPPTPAVTNHAWTVPSPAMPSPGVVQSATSTTGSAGSAGSAGCAGSAESAGLVAGEDNLPATATLGKLAKPENSTAEAQSESASDVSAVVSSADLTPAAVPAPTTATPITGANNLAVANSDKGDSNTLVYVIGGAAACLGMVLVVALVLMYRRRQRFLNARTPGDDLEADGDNSGQRPTSHRAMFAKFTAATGGPPSAVMTPVPTKSVRYI